jgi:alkanesulfonate monooxygenase SsuD/methylene tetrahydromethanopterin reductase-like flavin-dependent oxidoreductase (luciferase family)
LQVALTLDLRNAPERRRPWKEFWEDGLWLLAEAEAMGFDSVMVQQHFFQPDGYGPSMPVLLTLLAERTQRIRIGSYLYILPLYNPAALAQECSVLDHVSGGRLEVCVGLGHSLAEYAAFGIDRSGRGDRMDEALEVLKRAWTERPFTHHGRFYQLDDLEVRPEPLQQPHPPLWVGATTAAAAARAGRHGAHLAAASADPAVYQAHRDAWREAGHDPSAARLSNCLSITTTHEKPDAVWERNRELYFYRWDFYRRIREELGDPMLQIGTGEVEENAGPGAPSPESYRENELIGTPDEVFAALEPMSKALGTTDLVVNGPASGLDWRGEGYESVRLFAEEVLPRLKALG